MSCILVHTCVHCFWVNKHPGLELLGHRLWMSSALIDNSKLPYRLCFQFPLRLAVYDGRVSLLCILNLLDCLVSATLVGVASLVALIFDSLVWFALLDWVPFLTSVGCLGWFFFHWAVFCVSFSCWVSGVPDCQASSPLPVGCETNSFSCPGLAFWVGNCHLCRSEYSELAISCGSTYLLWCLLVFPFVRLMLFVSCLGSLLIPLRSWNYFSILLPKYVIVYLFRFMSMSHIGLIFLYMLWGQVKFSFKICIFNWALFLKFY